MAQIKYLDLEGLGKVKTAYEKAIEEAVKSFITGVTVADVEGTVEGGIAKVDLSSVLQQYAKTEDLEKIVGHIALKGSCLKEDLATKQTEATVGDIYVVTDDDNHFYLFVGVDGEGAEQKTNGFIDLGAHTEIKLDEYLKTTTADETYVKIEGGVEQLKTELDEAYCKVEDNYLKTQTAEETYTKPADFVPFTESEINEALGIGV